MEYDLLFEKVESLLLMDNLENAITLLIEKVKNHQTISLSARLESLRNATIRGILSDETNAMERNKLRDSILSYCQLLKNESQFPLNKNFDEEMLEMTSEGIILTDVKTLEIDIKINRDFNTYSAADQEKLLAAIKNILEINGDVNIKQKRKGSVIITLELNPEQCEMLHLAIQEGKLKMFNVIGSEIKLRGTGKENNHLHILLKGVIYWNNWRDKNNRELPYLPQVNLSKANLAGANLAGANLAGANLAGANLMNADLSGTNLIGANLYQATLTGAKLYGAKLYEANLVEANLYGAGLYGAGLYGADLSRARLSNSLHAGVATHNMRSIRRILFKRGVLRKGVSRKGVSRKGFHVKDFSGVDFSGVNLSGAKLIGAKLTGVKLTGTVLLGANLSLVNLSDTVLSGVNLSKVNLSGANLSGANLSDANFFKANLSDADLSWTDLSGADLLGADLSRAVLDGANLAGANLAKANLSEAFLGRTKLNNSNITLSQAKTVLSLFDCTGLNDKITFSLQESHPQLFNELKF